MVAVTGSPKVLQVITDTDRRGAQLFAVSLAPELVRRGFAVETVALAAGTSASLDVEVLGSRPLGSTTLRALRERSKMAAVLVAHGSTALPACFLATLGTRRPFVYRNIGDPYYWGSTRARRARTMLFLSRASRVVALTDETARRLNEIYRVPPRRMVTIPQAVSTADFPRRSPASRARAREALGIADDAKVAVCIGALSPEKSVPDAVRAVARLPPAWQLLVAGEGPERPAVADEALAAGAGRVRLLGQIQDTAELLSAADVLVLPSLTEGLPGVLIEAAMTGVPAVATDVGFVDDVIDDGITGFVVAPGDPGALANAIIRGEAAGLERLGEAANRRAQDRFSLTVAADRWADTLRSVAGADTGRRGGTRCCA